MKAQFSRIWNVAGKTWISAHVAGPWALDNSLQMEWGIIHTESGKTKKIGPARMRGINYFDRAMEEANRRNLAILRKIPLTNELATRVIAENPSFVSAEDEGSEQEMARLVIDRMCDEAGYDYPSEHPDHRDALVAKLVGYR